MVMHLAPDLRRRWALRKAPAKGPMRDYLETPFPKLSTDYREVEILAIDLETTGLDPRRDDILSVGYVVMKGNRIDLGSARHRLVRTARAIPEASAIIHQITDDQAAKGDLLDDVLADLLDNLAGKVMLAHHASVEKGFLSDACQRVYGVGLPVPVIDTQALARRTFERRHIAFKSTDLRLHALSDRFNLPRYGAHNALSDALAAGELFLAQASHSDGDYKAPLRDFLSW
jgi:DNA polymerase-3 subunit epsilon